MKKYYLIVLIILSINAHGQKKSYFNDSPGFVKNCIKNSRVYLLSILQKEDYVNNFVLDSTASFGKLSEIEVLGKYKSMNRQELYFHIYYKGKEINTFYTSFDTTGQILARKKVYCDKILLGYKRFFNNEFKVKYPTILKVLADSNIKYNKLTIEVRHKNINNPWESHLVDPTKDPHYDFLKKVKDDYYYELNIDNNSTIVLLDANDIKNIEIEENITMELLK